MSNQEPLVSVVIPCYNHERYVKDCIQSVIDQTYQNIELIIIDDGSKDNSVAEIQKMVDKCKERFTRFEFRYRANVGLSATLNEALDWCQGKYFSAIASDDMMLSEKTSIQVVFLEKNKDVVAVHGNVYEVDANNHILREVELGNLTYSFTDIFLSKQKLNVCTQMTYLEHIKSMGGYMENCAIEDWYMWLKLSSIGKISNIDEALAKYRLHEDNTIKKGDVIYSAMLQISAEYRFHPLYLRAVKRIIWVWIASVILKNKSKGLSIMKDAFISDPMVIFNKDFYRCIRNLIFR